MSDDRRPHGVHLPLAQKRQIRDLIAEGHTISSVARVLGCTWAAAKRYQHWDEAKDPEAREEAIRARLKGENQIATPAPAVPRVHTPPAPAAVETPSSDAEAAPEPASLAPTADTPPPPGPIEQATAARIRTQALRMERETMRDIASERSLRTFLDQLASDTTERLDPPPPYVAPEITARTTTETLLLQFSDWHAYEIVKRERVLGLNAYDAPTFARRVRTVVNGAIGIKSKMESGGGWRFPRLVLPCNGDFVSGTIHEAERHADSPNIVMSVYGCARTLALAVRDLAAHFEQVTVPCISGNHGRLPDARKMQMKDPLGSWDTLIYLIAKTALEDVPNVKFLIPDAYQLMFDIDEWRFLQYHGQSIKSTFSIPYYGIDRWSRNTNALMTLAERPVNYFLLGHFHQSYTKPSGAGRGEILGNGSLIGGTEYGLEGLGAADIPSQGLYGVHPDRGVTHRWPICADDDECEASYPVYPWTADVG